MLSTKVTNFSRCLVRQTGALSCLSSRQKHTLPDLPYEHNALEPIISGDIMKLHHLKHHQTYVNNLNAVEAKVEEARKKGDISTVISLQTPLKFNAGGVVNHSIFWKNLSPNGGGEPKGELLDAIRKDFGSFDKFRNMMTDQTVGVMGSGWGWLGYNPATAKLAIATTPNQDLLFANTGLVPLLAIDVWEHAYYLQYKNVRPDYVKAIWNVVNWNDVTERFVNAKQNH